MKNSVGLTAGSTQQNRDLEETSVETIQFQHKGKKYIGKKM